MSLSATIAGVEYGVYETTLKITHQVDQQDTFSLDILDTSGTAVFTKFQPAGVIKARGEKMARRDFTATFELAMARKDMRLMLEAAAGQPMTVLPSIAKAMDEAIANGHGKDDLGSIAAAVVA